MQNEVKAQVNQRQVGWWGEMFNQDYSNKAIQGHHGRPNKWIIE